MKLEEIKLKRFCSFCKDWVLVNAEPCEDFKDQIDLVCIDCDMLLDQLFKSSYKEIVKNLTLTR